MYLLWTLKSLEAVNYNHYIAHGLAFFLGFSEYNIFINCIRCSIIVQQWDSFFRPSSQYIFCIFLFFPGDLVHFLYFSQFSGICCTIRCICCTIRCIWCFETKYKNVRKNTIFWNTTIKYRRFFFECNLISFIKPQHCWCSV